MSARGRPSLDDDDTLKKVARKLAGSSRQSSRSAIVQCLPDPSDTNVRRLQRKWRAVGGRYLAQAREEVMRQRAEQAMVIERETRRDYLGDSMMGGVFGSLPVVADLDRLTAGFALITAEFDRAMAPWRDQVSEAGRQFELMQRALGDSPAMKAIRDLDERHRIRETDGLAALRDVPRRRR